MRTTVLPGAHCLEGRRVTVALRDGSRIKDCQLVSAHRPGARTLWLFVDGIDTFLPTAAVIAYWEISSPDASDAEEHPGEIARRTVYELAS